MHTEVAPGILVLPLLALLLLYWGAVLVYFRRHGKRAEAIVDEAARKARDAGTTSFEVGIPVPLGGLLTALLLPLVLLGILTLMQ